VPVLAAPPALGQTFTYTGAEQSYLVPSGVAAVNVVASGAPGGGGTVVTGGRGAVVSAEVPIPQGQTVLYVEVGGTGTGFNGGGLPNGGDASDIRLLPRTAAGSINSRVIVAAGGGGDGNMRVATPGALAAAVAGEAVLEPPPRVAMGGKATLPRRARTANRARLVREVTALLEAEGAGTTGAAAAV
jgi:hypothetical protein